jgi:hypothetical protein
MEVLGSGDESRTARSFPEALPGIVHPYHQDPSRKLRVLIISMGGARRKFLEEQLFQDPAIQESFEPPAFSPGVPSRSLRSRRTFFEAFHQAGLLPEAEWHAIRESFDDGRHEQCPNRWLDECLVDVPVEKGRHGNEADVRLHYSVELWRKAKTINRGRAVLACTLAHLIALRRLVDDQFDLVLEDNVRLPVLTCYDRISATLQAAAQWANERGSTCHLLYFGWLGSITNLEWIFSSYAPRHATANSLDDVNEMAVHTSVVPFPTLADIEEDLASGYQSSVALERARPTEIPERISGTTGDCSGTKSERIDNAGQHDSPGGTPVWGAYAYWISSEGYDCVLENLRRDVGALLWKGKRARYYQVT